VHDCVDDVTPLVEHVVSLVQSRKATIKRLRVCPDVDPSTRVLALDLSPRTRNAILRAGGLIEGDRLARLTWGQLLQVRRLGVRSALEFATVLDATTRRRKRGTDEPNLDPSSRRVLERVARTRWAATLTLNDPRLGDLARRDRRTVAECINEAVHAADAGHVQKSHQMLSVIDGVSEFAEQLEAQPLEQQLRDLVSVLLEVDGQRLHALAARMGLNGPACTLQEAGDIAGVSRERIRQLQAKLEARLRATRHIYLPALDAALETIRSETPLRIDDANRLLARAKRTRGRLDVICLVSEWMRLLGRADIALAEFAGTTWLIRPELGSAEEQLAGAGYFDAETDAAIVDACTRLTRSVGVCSLRWIAQEASVRADREGLRGVRRVLKASAHFAFLDRQWVWDPDVPAGRNRLENTLRKILAVARRVHLDVAMEALDRIHRQGRLPFVPDRQAVAFFAGAHPNFVLDDEYISTELDLSPESELGNTEQIFVEVLSAVPGGVLDREALRRACIERGMNAATFGQYTSFSPILTQPGRNLWALRGRDVDKAAVKRVGALKRGRRRHAKASRTPNGDLVVRWTVTTPENSVFGIPAGERSGYINRDYAAIDVVSGRQVGTIRVDDGGMSWGYGPFLRAARVAVGDRIFATFDRVTRVVTLDVERGADRPWVGDLGNCFLHADSWALRLYIDDGLLSGEEWDVPLSLADAVGIHEGVSAIPWRADHDVSLTLERGSASCTASPLKQVLERTGVGPGDRAFVELHSSWFDIDRYPQASAEGEPLSELLASAGLPQSLLGERAWNALSRALGGSSDGSREEVEERIRQRGDQVALGLLQRLRTYEQSRARTAEWADSWWLYAPLVAHDGQAPMLYAVQNEQSEPRVAVGVALRGAALPPDAVVDQMGRVWTAAANELSVVSKLRGLDAVVLTGTDPAWAKWARAEHHARRTSLGSSWEIRPASGDWELDGESFPDLCAALNATSGTHSDDEPRYETSTVSYPNSGYAFRRVVSDILRDKVVAIRGVTGALEAEFADGGTRRGLALADLAP
jgi:hypothetical protein